jgi:hypothetical protein
MRGAACREHAEIDQLGNSQPASFAVCADCLMRSEYLDLVMSLPRATYGVWAGTARRQRGRMHATIGTKRRDSAQCPRRSGTDIDSAMRRRERNTAGNGDVLTCNAVTVATSLLLDASEHPELQRRNYP